MKNLKPNSIEWLEFARSIGATHWHNTTNLFVKGGDGENARTYNRELKEWTLSGLYNCPEKNKKSWEDALIDFSPLDDEPSESVVNKSFTTEKVVSSKMEPTTWNGTGRPPVGTVCEAKHFGEWIECRIEKHLTEWNNVDVIYSYDNGTRWEYSGSSEHFRPIKSDRERWIDAVDNVLEKESCLMISDFQLGVIYDAGLAKLPD